MRSCSAGFTERDAAPPQRRRRLSLLGGRRALRGRARLRRGRRVAEVRRHGRKRRKRGQRNRRSLPRRGRFRRAGPLADPRAASDATRRTSFESSGPRWSAIKTFPRRVCACSKTSPTPSTRLRADQLQAEFAAQQAAIVDEQRLFDARRARLDPSGARRSRRPLVRARCGSALDGRVLLHLRRREPSRAAVMTAILVGSHWDTVHRHRRVLDAILRLGASSRTTDGYTFSSVCPIFGRTRRAKEFYMFRIFTGLFRRRRFGRASHSARPRSRRRRRVRRKRPIPTRRLPNGARRRRIQRCSRVPKPSSRNFRRARSTARSWATDANAQLDRCDRCQRA